MDKNRVITRYNDEFIREDDWKKLDEAVGKVMASKLNGVADLVNGGLVAPISGWDTVVSTWNTTSPFDNADSSLDIVSGSAKDRVVYGLDGTTIPVIWKDYSLSARQSGGSLPMDSAIAAAEAVARKMEYILFNGDNSSTSAYNCYGYVNHPANQDVTVSNWSSATTNVIANVESMLSSMHANGFDGAMNLYVPLTWYTPLTSDYHATHDGSFIERIAQYGITVKATSQLSVNVALVQLDSSSIDLALPISPINIIWADYGNGLVKEMRVVAAMSPRMKRVGNGSTTGLVGVVIGSL